MKYDAGGRRGRPRVHGQVRNVSSDGPATFYADRGRLNGALPKRPKNVTEFQDRWDLSANKLEVIICGADKGS